MPESPPWNDRNAPPSSSQAAAERLLETPPTFRAIYEGHFDFVWRFAAHCGVPQAALDGVVHKVFMVVHRQLGGAEERAALRMGIARIARNVVRNYLRTQFRQASGELPSDELYPSNELGPAERLDQKSASELLDIILARMTELQCEAFILREIEGLSLVETAQALSVDEEALRTRLRDARKVFNAVSAQLRAQRFWVTREGGKPR